MADKPVAIITGGSRGVGEATATLLSSKGWNVSLTCTSTIDDANKVGAHCKQLGSEAHVVKGVVSDDKMCRQTVEETFLKWGRIDSLVNNAGTTKFVFDHSDLEGLDAEDFLRIYKVNVVGPFQMVRACKEYLLKSDNHRTIVKRIIVERYFFHKLLEIYEMDLQQSNITNEKLIDIVKRLAPLVDVVIVADFGHDMISDKLVKIIEKYSKYLSLNVQMNAGNMGYNTLSKYSRADYVSVTEAELRLDSQERYGNLETLISDTSDRLGTSMFSITQGGDGCVVKSKKNALAEIPAIIAKDEVVDRVGAGDVFFAVTSLLASLNAPPDVLGLIGNVVAADSVRSIGTGARIKRVNTIRSLATLLK